MPLVARSSILRQNFRAILTQRGFARKLLSTGSYPCSQGSGNAYASSFLSLLKEESGFFLPSGPRSLVFDTILVINAPLYGQVATIRQPLVYYRLHASNYTQQDQISIDRFTRLVEYHERTMFYFSQRCNDLGFEFDAQKARQRNLPIFESRIAVSKLQAIDELSAERPLQVLLPALVACAKSTYSLRQRFVRGLWLTAVALSPGRLARWLIGARFMPSRRPKWLESLWGHRSKSNAVSSQPPLKAS